MCLNLECDMEESKPNGIIPTNLQNGHVQKPTSLQLGQVLFRNSPTRLSDRGNNKSPARGEIWNTQLNGPIAWNDPKHGLNGWNDPPEPAPSFLKWNGSDPPPPAPNSSRALTSKWNGSDPPPPAPNTTPARRPQTIAVPPWSEDQRRPHSIAVPDSFKLYTPPTPIDRPKNNFEGRVVPNVIRRPHSVATTPVWNDNINRRPHSIAITPNNPPPTLYHPVARRVQPPPASQTWAPRRTSPSDSGYRSLPTSASEHQLKQLPDKLSDNSRRNSLPGSAQTLLRPPKPSPTFHGLPFRPFTCGVSPNGTPLFLGCTHPVGGHNNTSASTPSTPASTPSSITYAVQQLMLQPRNGFNILDDRMSLFIDILDTQERFAQVSVQTINVVLSVLKLIFCKLCLIWGKY